MPDQDQQPPNNLPPLPPKDEKGKPGEIKVSGGEPPKKNHKKLLLVIPVVLVLGALAAGGYMLFKNGANPLEMLRKEDVAETDREMASPNPEDTMMEESVPAEKESPFARFNEDEEDGCKVGGCNGTLCSEGGEGATICDVQPEYACYSMAICERQDDGTCGWTQTAESRECFAEYEVEIPADYNTNDGQRKSDIYKLQSALLQHQVDMGQRQYFADSLQQLVTDNYFNELPKDPVTNESYIYEVSEDRSNFTLTAILDDGTEYTVSSSE